MSINQLKQKAIARVEEAFQQAEKHYGASIPRVPVTFSPRQTRTAGTASFNRDLFGNVTPKKITLSVPLLKLNGEEFIERTPGHEAAHIIAMTLFGKNGLGHGRRWKEVMRVIGQSAERCHSMEVPKGNNVEAWCSCDKPHLLSKTRANKLARGAACYTCRKCRQELSLTKKLTSVTVEKIEQPKPAPKKATKPKATKPKATKPKAPAQKKGSKAQMVRAIICTWKEKSLSLEDVLASKGTVDYCAEMAGLKYSLAVTYIKNNWNKV